MTDSYDAMSDLADDGDPMATRVVRASASPTRAQNPLMPPEAAVVTAELPVQRAPSGAVARRPAGPAMARRRPAPVGIQILVWVLALILLVVLVGAVVTALSPSSMTFLRHTVSSGLGATGSTRHLRFS